MRTAAALIIGNELLSGKIAEQNLLVLSRLLRSIGIQLRRVVMILDEIDVIRDEVAALSRDHDVLFTSGGVGPTHDDLTIEGVARAFGAGVVMSAEIERLLRGYYGAAITEGHLLMARVPEGARRLRDALRAADGVLLSAPEYNGFPTPLLLNSFDWLSRLQPEGDEIGRAHV